MLTLEEQQEDEEEIWNLLEQAVRGACDQVCRDPSAGKVKHLKRDLLLKLDEMLSLVAVVEERSPQIVQRIPSRSWNNKVQRTACRQLRWMRGELLRR